MHGETPLMDVPGLATDCGVGAVLVKDESQRMGLGSFKALGAAFAIAADAAVEGVPPGDHATALAGRTYVTASAGNHGMSVAAGARVFGADAVVYLAETVPDDTLVFNESDLEEPAVARQLDILVLRHVLEKVGDRYGIIDQELAAYYANSLSPHLEMDQVKSLETASSK